jgi:hypothetical protein
MTNPVTESFDLHVHAFSAGEVETISGIEQMFGVDAAQAARVYAAVPTTLKRGLSHAEAVSFATALQRIGAQVSLTVSLVPPSLAAPEPAALSAQDRDRRNDLVRRLLDAGAARQPRVAKPQTWSGHDVELPPDTPSAVAEPAAELPLEASVDPSLVTLLEERPPAALFEEGWMPGVASGPPAAPPGQSADLVLPGARQEPPPASISLPALIDDVADAIDSLGADPPPLVPAADGGIALDNSIPPGLGGGVDNSIPPGLGSPDSIPPALGGGDSIPPALGGGDSIPPGLAAPAQVGGARPAAVITWRDPAGSARSSLAPERVPTYLDHAVRWLDAAQGFVTSPTDWTRTWAETTYDALTARRGVRRVLTGRQRFAKELAEFVLWLYAVMGPALGWLARVLTRKVSNSGPRSGNDGGSGAQRKG